MSTGNSRHKARRLSYDPLRRSALACNRCRGRKTKCTGTPPHQCSACLDVGAECIYTETERRITVPESYLLDLQRRAREIPEESTKSGPSVSDSPLTVDDEELNQDDDWWYKGMDNLWLTRSGEHHYVGSGSSTYLAQRLNPAEANLAWDAHPMYKDPSSLKRPPTPFLPQLPPFEFAKRLYTVQNAFIGGIFHFCPPSEFEARLRQAYDHPPESENREDTLSYCLVLLLLCYGSMYSVNQWAGSDGPPGFNFFRHALFLLPEIHQEGSVLFVQVLGLIAPYFQNLNRKDAAFLYIGLAMRMAISLGLHQEVADDMGPIEREARRRLWWSVYSMDRIISVKSGNPISIHDEDIGAAWPIFLVGVDHHQSSSRILSQYTRLSRILGRIGGEIYRKKHRPGTSLLRSVQSIMTDLSNWLKDVPAEISTSSMFRESVSTFLHYYHCVTMTTRPFLLFVAQKRLADLANNTAPSNWREGLSGNIVMVIDNAIAAARASAMTMNMAVAQNQWATYGFMDGEHAFSTSLTLVLVNVAFPYNERDAAAMDIALSVLRGMAEKGNEYIQARLKLLMGLRASMGHQQVIPAAAALPMPPPLPMAAADTTTMQPQPQQAPAPPSDTLGQVPSIISYPQNPFQPFQDISFNFDVDDNDGLWDEISGNLDIDMDTGWIENALRKDHDGPIL